MSNKNETPEKNQDDSFLPAALEEVHEVLRTLNMPPLKDLRNAPPLRSNSGICVVLLSEPGYRFGHLLEGGRQSSGDVILALSPLWLELRKGKECNTLWLKTGLYYDGVNVVLTHFEPRKVTYFANFLTFTGTEGVRNDGVPLEENLECPMSSSSLLEKYTNDKLHTRILLSGVRISVPISLAFPFQSSRVYTPLNSDITVVPISSRTGHKQLFRDELVKFLPIVNSSRVVIKPSGPLWMGSYGVKFFEVGEVDEMVAYLDELLQKLHPEDSMLVDQFLFTMPSHFVRANDEIGLNNALATTKTTVIQDPSTLVEEVEALLDDEVVPQVVESDSLNYRLRVNVVRTQVNTPVVTAMVTGVGPSNEPLHGDNTFPQTFQNTLKQWGVKNLDEVVETVRVEAISCMKAMHEFEANDLTPEQRGGKNAWTDMIGIDFILTLKGNLVVPAVIEINDHDSTSPGQQLEFYSGYKSLGTGVAPWITHMLSESQIYSLKAKCILIVGAGGYSKQHVWRALKKMEINLVIVDHDANHYARPQCDHFIHIPDLDDHSKDEQHTERICKEIANLNIDGCVTFWQDAAALSARVAHKMGWVGPDWEGVATAMSKSATLSKIRAARKFLPVVPTCSLYAVPTFSITSIEDLRARCKKFPFPAVLKLDHGSSAVGVQMASNAKEAIAIWNKFYKQFQLEQSGHVGIGLSLGFGVTMMQYIQGSEHDIDIGLYEGQIVFAFVTDNGPTRLPLFTETSACLPTTLNKAHERTLIKAAQQICRSLGLHTGVFNVEMKYTPSGPRLIEVNPRMGGFYISEWIHRVWGLNLVQATVMIALGIRPVVQVPTKPLTYSVGLNLVASQNSPSTSLESFQKDLKRMQELGLADLLMMEDEIPKPAEFEEPFANLSVSSKLGWQDAAGKLTLLLKALNLDNGEVSVDYFINNLFLNIEED